jgi:hypothetical protein
VSGDQCVLYSGPWATVPDEMGGGNGVLSVMRRQVDKRVRSFTFITILISIDHCDDFRQMSVRWTGGELKMTI